MYNADLEFSTNVTLHHILAGVTERDTVRYRIFWASKIGFLRSILEVQGDRPLVELPGASMKLVQWRPATQGPNLRWHFFARGP